MAHTDFVQATVNPIDVRNAVVLYRESSTALRRLVQVRPSRNFRTTERAITRHVDVLRTVELSLVLADQLSLVGALTDERNLLFRLAEAKRLGHERPELKTRLANNRRSVKILVAAAGA